MIKRIMSEDSVRDVNFVNLKESGVWEIKFFLSEAMHEFVNSMNKRFKRLNIDINNKQTQEKYLHEMKNQVNKLVEEITVEDVFYGGE